MSSNITEQISTDFPCGSDFKYEDIYLSIDAEIDKSNNVIEGMETDWNSVSSSTEEVLSKHTKDVKVLCWWAYALWKQEQWTGLEKALPVFNTLLSTYKDTLFPKSKKVKLSSMNWLEEKLNEDVLDDNGNISGHIDHQKFFDFFSELEKNFALTILEEKSIFSKIQRALKRTIDEKEAQSKVSEEKKEASNKPASSEVDEIASDSDAAKILSTMKKNATLLKNYWREKEHGSLGAIRLTRMISWLETDGLPMNEDGKAPLNSPSQETIDEIDTLYTEEKYTEALEKVEHLISFSPFWLDGHFISFNILTALGDTKAALEVKNALIAYVNADRKVLELSFRDSTPFASVKVKEWIGQSTGSSESSEVSKQDSKHEQTLEECYSLAKKKNIKEAMKILQTNYASAPNKEEQFLWRISHAELAQEFGKNELALALVEDLKREIDLYKLDEWNPKLSARVFTLFLGFKRTLVDVEELQAVYARLCKIDVEEALEIKI